VERTKNLERSLDELAEREVNKLKTVMTNSSALSRVNSTAGRTADAARLGR